MGSPVPGRPTPSVAISPPKYVFRALRSTSWVQRGIINANAFRRRGPDTPHPDLEGLSVDYTYESAKSRFKKGAIRINVKKLEKLGLRIVPTGDHANIQEVPYDIPGNESDVLKWAEAIITCCS
jgi:hypothetical protein